MDLSGVLERVKELAGRVSNEESTKQHLILPTLMALGWDVFNPDEVMPETHTEEGRPDYALMINGRTVAFLEAKGVKEKIFTGGRLNPRHARQLARYCFDRGIRLGILTNGIQWALINAFEDYKSVEERVVLAVDLMDQSTEEAAERLRWLSKGKITNYRNIPPEYSRVPTQVPARTISASTLLRTRPPQDHRFRTLYVSAREIPSLPASAIPVRELLGTDLRGYVPGRLFVNFDGKWYEVIITRGENWPRVKIAWSSVTAMVVRFLCDRRMCDLPEIGQFITRQYPQTHPEWYAKIDKWYLRGPGNGEQAVRVFHELERYLGIEIAVELSSTGALKSAPS